MQSVADWWQPFAPGVLETIEQAANAAVSDSEVAKRYPYRVIPTRSKSSIVPWQSNSGRLAALRRIKHGRAGKISLPFQDVTGIVGSYALACKQRKTIRKENALLFIDREAESGKVLKIAVGPGNLAREIRVFIMLAESGIVPRLFASDPSKRWFLMEKLETGVPRGTDQADRYLKEIGPVQFSRFGMKEACGSRVLGQLGIGCDEFLNVANKLKIYNPQSLLHERLAISLTHGHGLCSEIMERKSNGRAVMLDWELAKVAPVAFDVLQAAVYQPNEALKFMEDRACANGVMSARRQFQFGLVCLECANPELGLSAEGKMSETGKQYYSLLEQLS